MDADGTFGLGFETHTNLKYKNTNIWIGDKAKKTKKNINIKFGEWKKSKIY